MDKHTEAKRLSQDGLSLREIATKLKVSKSSVANWIKEKPTTKSWLSPTWSQIGGGPSGTVDAYNAIQEPTLAQLLDCYDDTVFSCARWLSDTLSATPLRVYVKTAKGQPQPKCVTRTINKTAALDHLVNLDLKEVVGDTPFKEIIDKPNQHMDRGELLRIVDINLSLTGNAFIHKRREDYEIKDKKDLNDGLPVELWPLQPQFITLAANDRGHFIGFWDARFNEPKFIPYQDMLWFKFVDPRNPFGLGMSPVRGVYERVLNSKNEAAYLSALYRNQARPDSMITIENITADEAEVTQKQYNMRFKQGGIGGVIVVPGGDMDVKPLSWSPKDVLGVDVHRYVKQCIQNAFGINNAVFDSESSNRATAETALFMAIRNGVLPRLRLIETKINQNLAPEFDERLMAVFDNPCSEDKLIVLQEQTELLDRRVLDIDEVRQERGMAPRPADKQTIGNDLRSTVQSVMALKDLQESYYAGRISREAAIANVHLLFSFGMEESATLFPIIAPKPLIEKPIQEKPETDVGNINATQR